MTMAVYKPKYVYRFKTMGLFFSIVYWLSDSIVELVVHHKLHFEWFPSDPNELGIRSVIVLLVFITSSYADHYTYLLRKHEWEKSQLFEETVRASHHILNNLLNQMNYYKLLAEESHDFDHEELVKFDTMMREAKAQILALEEIGAVSTDSIKKLYP